MASTIKMGQPLLGDSLSLLLTSKAGKELLRASKALRVVHINMQCENSNTRAASYIGSASKFTAWSLKGVVGSLITYLCRNLRIT